MCDLPPFCEVGARTSVLDVYVTIGEYHPAATGIGPSFGERRRDSYEAYVAHRQGDQHMSDPSDSSPRRSRARGFRILGWLAVASMLALALLGPSAAGVAALSGAVYTSNADGSVIDANHYDTKGDVYLTGGPCNGGSHLAAGDYYFEVVQPAGGGALLSTDAVGNRKFTVGADGFISSTSGTHATHAVNCTPAVTGVTIQLIPYGDSSNGTYKLQVATASSAGWPSHRRSPSRCSVHRPPASRP